MLLNLYRFQKDNYCINFVNDKRTKNDKIKLGYLHEKQKTLFEKYNTESDMSLNITWDEYKTII